VRAFSSRTKLRTGAAIANVRPSDAKRSAEHDPSRPAPSLTGHDLSRIPIQVSATAPTATGSPIGHAGDVLEREADRIAAVVTATTEPVPSEGPDIERSDANARATAGTGQRLPSPVRRSMESRFGHDFSRVRVHTDGRAAEMARDARANACTTGENVFFAAGRYEPETARGRRLLAHELTHVLQQRAMFPDAGATSLVQCQPATEPQAPGDTTKVAAKLPSAEELTAAIARCIGIYETNRGKDQPNPKESVLKTVAGVAASLPTIEQATTAYILSALKAHKDLRDLADPPLTLKEIQSAEKRCAAVDSLLKLVAAAVTAKQTDDDFIAAHADEILATGLSNDDVKTMFKAVALKATIDAAHSAVTAKKKTLKESIDAIPEADRLGLNESSLKAYINKPSNWGENRAAWERKAVAAMPDNIGARIESVAVSSKGTALAKAVIKTRVDAALAKQPPLTEEEIVKTVAQKNNPGEKNYGENVWKTYSRLYRKSESAEPDKKKSETKKPEKKKPENVPPKLLNDVHLTPIFKD
jgi:Domain of unknown function (DUF4157)